MNEPPEGVTSALCTKKSAGLLDPTRVDQTCTVPVDNPPVTVAEKVCAAVASIVSMTVL